MNLSDVILEGKILEGKLKDLDTILGSFLSINKSSEELVYNTLVPVLNWNSSAIDIIRTNNDSYYRNFLTILRKLDFTDSILLVSELRNLKGYYNLDTFVDNYIKNIKIINEFRAEGNITLYPQTKQAINDIIEQCNMITDNIHSNSRLGEILNINQSDNGIKIRLLNEKNNVSNLIKNLSTIQDIYNNINKVIGNEEELKYCRVESGSFEIYLCGCLATLTAMKPILEFAYKVYTEQFSRKARLELQEKDIKVRGEYLKFMKEVAKALGIENFGVENQNELLSILGNLDIDIKTLYKNNPFIMIDNERLGSEDLNNKDIPIEFLKSSDEEILSLSELEKTEE